MLRVPAFVPYPPGHAPGQRYRMEQWAPLLQKEGVTVVFSGFLAARAMGLVHQPGHTAAKARATASGYVRRLGEGLGAADHDVAYVYRETSLLAPAAFERWVLRRRPYVFDFDDAIYLPVASPGNSWTAWVKSPGKVAALCAGAREVTVGNETLAAYARQHAASVTVIPSTIDTTSYTMRPRPENARPVVGWTGSATTLAHLEALGPALARLRQLVDYEMRVIGGRAHLPGVDLEARPWRAETEVDDLRALDVGLMPLADDEWCRGKCGMKALQYMALGIPPVVSPVGMNGSLVQDGVNGFHARTSEEWVDRIALLLGDAALRVRLGLAARATVERGYSAAGQAPRMADVLRRAARP